MRALLKFATYLGFFSPIFLISSCGSDDGILGSPPTLVSDTNSLTFTVEERENSASPQSFTVEIENLDQFKGELWPIVWYSNSVVADVGLDIYGNSAVITVYPKKPAELGLGEYTGEVIVEVCYEPYEQTPEPCSNNIPGSPYLVAIDYVIYADYDYDGIWNNVDLDDDNDGIPDTEDALPLDRNEYLDTDNDGIGNNSDNDDDNDGYYDFNDDFPLDPSENRDTDGDGQGDNSDPDIDGDGVENQDDLFPFDPSPDLDSDGVENQNDDYPRDPAFSIDSDDDGYPDAWNTGYPEEGVFYSLVLDEFPNDPECWLASHADEFGQCDFGSATPYFIPDNAVADDNGVIYLLGKESRIIYRWSTQLGEYLAPIYVGRPRHPANRSPISMSYSKALKRLYLGYQWGDITYVDLTKPQLREYVFTSGINNPRHHLLSIGELLYTQSQDTQIGSKNIIRIKDKDGNLLNVIREYYRGDPVWDPSTYTVYSFDFNRLSIRGVNPQTGRVTKPTQSDLNELDLQPPIVLSPDGQFFSLGSGGIYYKNTLEWRISIAPYKQAIWLDNGNLVTLRQGTEEINLTVYGEFINIIEERTIPGNLVDFIKTGSSYSIVYGNAGKVVIEEVEF